MPDYRAAIEIGKLRHHRGQALDVGDAVAGVGDAPAGRCLRTSPAGGEQGTASSDACGQKVTTGIVFIHEETP